MQRGYSNDAFQTEVDASQRRRSEDRYQPPGRRRVDPYWDGRDRRPSARDEESQSRGPLSRDREPYAAGWREPESGRVNSTEERFHPDMPRKERRPHGGAHYHALGGDHRRQVEEDEVKARFQEYSHQGPDQRRPETDRGRGPTREKEYELQGMAHGRDRHGGRYRRRGREEMSEREPRGGFPYSVNRMDEYDENGGEFLHQPYIPAFRSPDDVDSRQQERWEEPREGRRYDNHRTSSEHWAHLQQMLPSQMDRNKGTLRFRGTLRGSVRKSRRSSEGAPPEAEAMPTTEEEIVEALHTLREQPLDMEKRRKQRQDLRRMLERTHKSWYSTRPVTSIVQQGSNSVKDFLHAIDPLRRILKRIEGRHGTSVVAVFNFLREMIQLNILLLLLLLGGIVIPSTYFVDDGARVQGIAWRGNDSCTGIELYLNNETERCNKNYTDVVQREVDNADGNFINLVGDFLQGTGFLEWTFLFSGRYPASVKSENYNLSLAYILTILAVYFISLVYVIYFVAKFLRQPSASPLDYGMTFSNIIFTGWDFTVSEEKAAKIERNLTLCEVKTAFDDADYKTKQEAFTKSDRIKLYLTRAVINFITLVLIGGGWVAIYFLVIEAENHTTNNTFEEFLWEYAPTVLVAAFNFIYPFIFDFVVEYEHHTGRTALLLTLGRCVFVRLTSLGILVITTLSVIYSKDRSCAGEDEYVCWETQMGKQVYSVLVLDTIIQIGVTFVVNVLRRALYRFDNKLCKAVGRIEFYVPGHVLDVVYMQTLCWIGVLYAPLLSGVGLIAFLIMFLLKLFTVTVTCFPATRVFRASRSSAMFMTILALAFLMCVVSSGMALLIIKPSLACSPFRGLDYAWEALTYHICQLDGSSVSWIRELLFLLDDMSLAVVLFVLVILLATYYVSLVKARGSLIRRLENKLKIMAKEKNFLLKEYNSISAANAEN